MLCLFKIGGSNFLGNVELITTVHFLRAREPFGASSPLARLDSAARLTLALDSLSLTSLCLAALRLRCGHPALHPSTSTLASSRRLLPSLAGKWEWTLVQRWIDPLCNLRLTPHSPSRFHGCSFLPFHPRYFSNLVATTANNDDDFSARRRTLIPISKIRLPSKPRIDWQKQRQRAPPKATPRLSLSFSATDYP